jgi:REP element-mobilizing transposase RayT
VESGFSRITLAEWLTACHSPRMIPLHRQPLRGFDYLDKYRYFITFCTYHRRPLFMSAPHVDLTRTQILRAAGQESFDLIAYCFMPDHVHLLVSGSLSSSDCRRFIARAKQFSGFYYQKEFRERLWQRYSYDYPYLGSSGYTVDQILDARQSG